MIDFGSVSIINLIHEIHVLEVQIEMNVYDPGSFLALYLGRSIHI